MSEIALSSRHTKMAETALGLHLTQREAGFLDQKPELAGPRKRAKAFQAEDNSKCKRKNCFINYLIVSILSSGKGI